MSTPQWRPVGSIRGPAGPSVAIEAVPFTMQGALRVKIGGGRYPIGHGEYLIESVTATVEQPASGAPVVLDVRVNGASIYDGHPDRRPTIPPGEHTAVVGAHNPTVAEHGDFLNVDVVSVGTILTGTHLTVVVRLQQIVAVGETLTGSTP